MLFIFVSLSVTHASIIKLVNSIPNCLEHMLESQRRIFLAIPAGQTKLMQLSTVRALDKKLINSVSFTLLDMF